MTDVENQSPQKRRTAFVYLRVSTRKQDEENQRIQIGRWAQEHAVDVDPGGWFVDHAVSGRKVPPLEREGFRAMYDLVAELKVQGEGPSNVLVYELSRVGRSFWEMLEVVRALEESAPIISTSPKESFLQIEDQSLRRFLLAMLAWAAEREADLISQRTLEGLERARQESRHSGVVPLGYSVDHTAEECERLGHDPRTCKVHGVLRLTPDGEVAYEMYLADPEVTPREIRKKLDELTSKQAWSLLQNVKKYGKAGTNGVRLR